MVVLPDILKAETFIVYKSEKNKKLEVILCSEFLMISGILNGKTGKRKLLYPPIPLTSVEFLMVPNPGQGNSYTITMPPYKMLMLNCGNYHSAAYLFGEAARLQKQTKQVPLVTATSKVPSPVKQSAMIIDIGFKLNSVCQFIYLFFRMANQCLQWNL